MLDKLIGALDAAIGEGHGLALAAQQLACTDKEIEKALRFVEENERDNARSELLRLYIPGDHGHARRPRKTRRPMKGGGFSERMHSDHEDERLNLVQLFKLQIPRGFVPAEGACEVSLDIFKPPPLSMPRFKVLLAEAGYVKPESAPDFDNYLKLACDAINTLVFRDDGQVTSGGCWKHYSVRPRAEVAVWGRRRRMHK